jgi:hypothetical protein
VYVKFHCFGHLAPIAPDHLKGIAAFEEGGGLLVCGDQAGKSDVEPLEEFWMWVLTHFGRSMKAFLSCLDRESSRWWDKLR